MVRDDTSRDAVRVGALLAVLVGAGVLLERVVSLTVESYLVAGTWYGVFGGILMSVIGLLLSSTRHGGAALVTAIGGFSLVAASAALRFGLFLSS